jgi:hypothetical protein
MAGVAKGERGLRAYLFFCDRCDRNERRVQQRCAPPLAIIEIPTPKMVVWPCQGEKPECEGHVCALLAQDELAAKMHRSLLHNIRADFQDFVIDLRTEEISISFGCVSGRVSAHFFLAVCAITSRSFHSSSYPLKSYSRRATGSRTRMTPARPAEHMASMSTMRTQPSRGLTSKTIPTPNDSEGFLTLRGCQGISRI